jgi:catechol 2,3-dioxygenase
MGRRRRSAAGDSDEDLKEALRVLQEAEVPLIGATDHTVTHSLYIEDPDGNEIELYIDVPGVDWKKDPDLFFSPGKRLKL